MDLEEIKVGNRFKEKIIFHVNKDGSFETAEKEWDTDEAEYFLKIIYYDCDKSILNKKKNYNFKDMQEFEKLLNKRIYLT